LQGIGKSIELGHANEIKLENQLLKVPSVTAEIGGLGPDDNRLVTHSLMIELQKAPQFSVVGNKDLSFDLKGSFTQIQTSKGVLLSHSYTVKIPYTAYKTVNNPVTSPYSESENRCDTTGHCWAETVTKYHQVDHFETLTETDYRDEPRVYQFNGTKHHNLEISKQRRPGSPVSFLSFQLQSKINCKKTG